MKASKMIERNLKRMEKKIDGMIKRDMKAHREYDSMVKKLKRRKK